MATIISSTNNSAIVRAVLGQVTKLCQRMMRAGEMARENLETAQTKMKAWYDRKA